MSAANELTGMIEKLVTEKTFTMDALEAIQALKVKAGQLETQNEKLDREVASYKKNAEIDTNLRLSMKSDLDAWKAREASIVARELKMFENEKSAAVATAVSAAYLTSMKIVFAPNTVRESVQKFGSVAGSNGMSYPTSDTGTITRAEGYADPISNAGYTDHGGVPTKL